MMMLRVTLLLAVSLAAVALAACAGASPAGTPAPAGEAQVPPAPADAPLAASTPAATALPTAAPTFTPVPVPPREIATGPVNRIVYASPDGHIYTANPDGRDRRQVSPATGPDHPGGQFTWPVWSPDGGSVLFSSVLQSPGGGADVSLVRAPALGGDTVTIYEDDPQSQGIGSGVAHFAMWSPDGERVALIAGTSQGLVTLMLDSQTGRRLEGVAIGSPVYLAWSPDSRFLAVHLQDLLFLYQLGQDGARGRRSVQLANIVGSYYAPQFAPGDNRIVYGDEVAGEGRLVLRMPDGLTTKDLGAGALNLAFGWSPDGETLAVMRGDSGWFDRLSIVAVSDGSGRDLLAKTMFGFWWSPDGRKIAVAAPSKSYQASVDWSVVDVATGHETPLGTLLPTPEFGFVLSFFDQYGNASHLWSPDSGSIVVAGTVLLTPESPAVNPAEPLSPPRGEPEQVWVLDASGAKPPRAIGPGFLAFWSPK